MSAIKRPEHIKYTTEELMEAIDVFNVTPEAQSKIRALLDAETKPPNAGNFFRYYNARSKTEQFEKEFAAKMGGPLALAVNSGTSALITALAAAGIGPGDEVIVPAYTFFASVSAIVVARAIPVITEINQSLTLDPGAVARNITARTKAIMPVHMIGYPTDMEAISKLAQQHNLVVIEDVAQAAGGSFRGRPLGTWGNIGCFSLDAYKVIGSGEGGVILTDDEWLYTRAQSYHDAAACWRPNRYASERREGELFCGQNYRLSELNAAVALAQLRKLDDINKRTKAIHDLLQSEIQLPACARWVKANDPDGLCGYTLPVLFETTQQAARAIKAGIGLGGLATGDTRGVRDWHVYWNWEQILEMKTVTPEGCPFKCSFAGPLPDYSPDMCPRTRDIMLRLGVFGITPSDTPEWASDFARRVSRKFAELF